MKTTLRTRLSLAFFAVVLAMAAFYSLLSGSFLDRQFEEFARNKTGQQISGLVSLLSSRYSDWGEQWDAGGLESLGVSALEQGLLLRLTASDGTLLWNAREHNDGMCNAILASIAETMQAQDNNFQGGYTEETYPVMAGGRQIASAAIGFYGPYFYSELDLKFLDRLNTILLWGAGIAALAAVTLGMLLAGQLSRPITRVIKAAHDIADGHYGSRIQPASGPRELTDLTVSVNRLAETLGQQDKLRRQLTADVAHELRTPLTIVQSHLEAMIDGTWPAGPERLLNCHREVERMSRLLGGLERLTALERQNSSLELKPLALNELVEQVAANFAADFSAKNIVLDLHLSPFIINGNQDMLSQVFTNLLANALKYTESGGQVSIIMQEEPNGVSVIIRDTGLGIIAEDLPHVFERFYRADKSRSRATGGAGIGLTIARSIVEAHGGTITVESEPGRGSDFSVILPRVPASKL